MLLFGLDDPLRSVQLELSLSSCADLVFVVGRR